MLRAFSDEEFDLIKEFYEDFVDDTNFEIPEGKEESAYAKIAHEGNLERGGGYFYAHLERDDEVLTITVDNNNADDDAMIDLEYFEDGVGE